MTTIAFVGTGHIGAQIARALHTAGHTVVLSNRAGPESLQPLVAELGDRATATPVQDVARDAELVVVAVPVAVFGDLPAKAFDGRSVAVTSNYNRDREGAIAAIDDGTATVPQLMQQQLPGSRVARAFSHISSPELTTDGRPPGDANRRALAYATDDAPTGTLISSLYNDIGFDALNLGGLDEAWRIDRGQPAFITHLDLDGLRLAVQRSDRTHSGR